tara:strand:- start:1641 stop:2042 length:402 start_codon:yes stop_codon:yes gene_type:complete
MASSPLIPVFNEQLENFMEDVCMVFPENVEIVTAKNTLNLLKKSNPKMLIRIWYQHVSIPYGDRILEGDIDFFIEKDYMNDVGKLNDSQKIMNTINSLKQPIRDMSHENKQKSMKYLQNLSKLSTMCHKSGHI